MSHQLITEGYCIDRSRQVTFTRTVSTHLANNLQLHKEMYLSKIHTRLCRGSSNTKHDDVPDWWNVLSCRGAPGSVMSFNCWHTCTLLSSHRINPFAAGRTLAAVHPTCASYAHFGNAPMPSTSARVPSQHSAQECASWQCFTTKKTPVLILLEKCTLLLHGFFSWLGRKALLPTCCRVVLRCGVAPCPTFRSTCRELLQLTKLPQFLNSPDLKRHL